MTDDTAPPQDPDTPASRTDLGELALADLEQEMANTRRVLEAMPADRLDYRPHEKSWSLGELATHMSRIPSWSPSILSETVFDLAEGPPPGREALPKDEVLAAFDAAVEEQRETLAGVEGRDFAEPWTLRDGDHEIFTMPRMMVFRVMAVSHMIHHRAQMTMYLRMLDVPVPGMYGPSADEKEG